MKYEKVISTDELELPDDPDTTRMATAVVVFCIFAGPTVLTSIMLIAIHAEAIEVFMNNVAVFLYRHPFFTFTLVLYFGVALVYAAIKKLLNR
jgi:hypothetical protein